MHVTHGGVPACYQNGLLAERTTANAWKKTHNICRCFKALCETTLCSVTQSSNLCLWKRYLDSFMMKQQTVVVSSLEGVWRHAGGFFSVSLCTFFFFNLLFMCRVHDISCKRVKINLKYKSAFYLFHWLVQIGVTVQWCSEAWPELIHHVYIVKLQTYCIFSCCVLSFFYYYY